ncbi:MAG: AbgT family transporter, partial [Acidobacteriota bacterium]
MTNSDSKTPQRKSAFTRFLDLVEWLGNLLPHPVTLFAIICVGVLLLSGVAGLMEWQVDDPRPEGARGRSADGVIKAVSLLNAEGFRRITTSLVDNFTGFAPLGTVLVAMLGVGIAETSGLLAAAVRFLVFGALGLVGRLESVPILGRIFTPKTFLTAVIVFAAVISNTASEMGYVVLIPLAAVVFHSVGRHPLAGLAAAFAGVSGGYSANVVIGTVDPLLSGITTEAARLIDPAYAPGEIREILPTANL